MMKKYKLKFRNWEDARWVINCAISAIEDSYKEGSVRRIEMEELYKDLHKQMEKQVGEKYKT